MRRDYDTIRDKFTGFISRWLCNEVNDLADFVQEDIHAWLSTQQRKDGAAHSLYGIRQFILETPKASYRWQVGNYICRLEEDTAWQLAQIPCIANGDSEERFCFIATFSNRWQKDQKGWRMAELRMDMQDFPSPGREKYAEKWYFEDPIAVLTATVHIPCIFSEMDNPYYRLPDAPDLLTEEEKIAECWYKFHYGIDWIMFLWVKETLADDFKNEEKRHFIAERKFTRQRYRYHMSGCLLEEIQICGDHAVAISKELVPEEQEKKVSFVRRNQKWQIMEIEEGVHDAQSRL